VSSASAVSPRSSRLLNFDGSPLQVTRALLAAGGSATSASGVAVPTTALLQEFDVLATKWLAKISAKPSKELDVELLKAVREGALAGVTGAK
jgi:hypothetical protein